MAKGQNFSLKKQAPFQYRYPILTNSGNSLLKSRKSCIKFVNYFRNKLLDWKNELLGGASDTIIELSEESLQKPDVADRAQLEADTSIQLNQTTYLYNY